MRLGYLGNTNLDIITTLVTKPWAIFPEAPPDAILLYTLGLLLPFLAIFRIAALPALVSTLPIFIINIISSEGMHRELDTHYSIAILPFLIAACLDSIQSLNSFSREIKQKIFQ